MSFHILKQTEIRARLISCSLDLPALFALSCAPLFIMSDNNTSDDDSFNRRKRFICEECDKTYSTRYNLERHINKFHRDSPVILISDSDQSESENESMSTDDNNEDMSDDENDTDINDGEHSSDDEKTQSNVSECSSDDEETESNVSEGERSSDDEETESNVTSMFRNIISDTFIEHEDELDPLIEENLENGLTKKEAGKRALLSSHAAKKTIQHLYAENIFKIMEQRADPLFKAILNKVKELRGNGFKLREAVNSAVSYRKHAIYNLVNFM